MLAFLSVLTYIGGALGTLTLLLAIGEDSAPRAAARAGVALALVVIPYCLAKVVWLNQQRADTKAILATLRKQAGTDNTPPPGP